MDVLKALPMAFVMVAGPQIVTAIMLATSRRPNPNSWAFLAGVAVATTFGLSLFYVLASSVHPDPSDSSSGSNVLNVVAVVLLVALAGLAFRNRNRTDPPKWMAKLQDAAPPFCLRIGFILFLVMPTDVITMFTVSNLVAHAGDPWWHTLLFMALTVVFAGIPLLLLTLLGARAEAALPRVRQWVSTNAWIVNEIVIAFFLVMSLDSLFGS
jgi:hypothetical protein